MKVKELIEQLQSLSEKDKNKTVVAGEYDLSPPSVINGFVYLA